MENTTQQTLIVALAHLLAEKQLSIKAIQHALTLFCNRFDFDYALHYEDNRLGSLRLADSLGSRPTQAVQKITPAALPPALLFRLQQETLLYFDAQGPSPAGTELLLSLLGAKSAAVISVADDRGRLYRLIAFCHCEDSRLVEDSKRQDLEIALSMVAGHATMRRYQNSLRISEAVFESILDNTGIDIYVNDFHTHDILYVNKSMAAPYGGQDQFASRKCWQVLFSEQEGPCEFCPQKKLLDAEGRPSKVYTWDYQRALDGSWFRVFSSAFLWPDGRLAHVVSSANITDNKRNEALIQYMANYDALTSLPNRRMLITACEQRIHKAAEDPAYLLFFDIDDFKNINDTFGHDAGDEFLIQLGEFFSSHPMLRDSIYRNGGDEFVALLDARVTEADVRNLAQFIHTRFKQPWVLKKGNALCNVSIGVALYPLDGHTSEELLRKADQAMYSAKKAGGRSLCFFSQPPS